MSNVLNEVTSNKQQTDHHDDEDEDTTTILNKSPTTSNLERKRSSLTIQIDSPKLHSDHYSEERKNLFNSGRLTRFIKYKGNYESTLYLPEKYIPEFQGDLVRALGLGSFSVVVSF